MNLIFSTQAMLLKMKLSIFILLMAVTISLLSDKNKLTASPVVRVECFIPCTGWICCKIIYPKNVHCLRFLFVDHCKLLMSCFTHEKTAF